MFEAPFGGNPIEFGDEIWRQKTRVLGLPDGEEIMPLAFFVLNGKMVNGSLIFIERLKASAWHQLYLPLLPFTHARSESINADSLKLQLLTARKKEYCR